MIFFLQLCWRAVVCGQLYVGSCFVKCSDHSHFTPHSHFTSHAHSDEIITSFFDAVEIHDYFNFLNLQVPVLLVDSRILADSIGELATNTRCAFVRIRLGHDDMLFSHGCARLSMLFGLISDKHSGIELQKFRCDLFGGVEFVRIALKAEVVLSGCKLILFHA